MGEKVFQSEPFSRALVPEPKHAGQLDRRTDKLRSVHFYDSTFFQNIFKILQ